MNKPPYSQQLGYWWREWVKPLAVILVLTSALRSALADWNDVPTGSMKPTIVEGDPVWVNKLAYDLKIPFTTLHLAEWGHPRRGDIVVCYSPHDGQRLVKRVVGLPGDRLEIRSRQLILNGQAIDCSAEEITLDPATLKSLEPGARVMQERLPQAPHLIQRLPAPFSASSIEPYTVPAGQYFLLGDNRDNSFDSRYFGCVPRSQILGRAEAVVVSMDRAHGYWPRLSRCFKKLE